MQHQHQTVITSHLLYSEILVDRWAYHRVYGLFHKERAEKKAKSFEIYVEKFVKH